MLLSVSHLNTYIKSCLLAKGLLLAYHNLAMALLALNERMKAMQDYDIFITEMILSSSDPMAFTQDLLAYILSRPDTQHRPIVLLDLQES